MNIHLPQVGDRLEIYWPHDDKYYSGKVVALLPREHHRIEYDDGEYENLILSDEKWRALPSLRLKFPSSPRSVSTKATAENVDVLHGVPILQKEECVSDILGDKRMQLARYLCSFSERVDTRNLLQNETNNASQLHSAASKSQSENGTERPEIEMEGLQQGFVPPTQHSCRTVKEKLFASKDMETLENTQQKLKTTTKNHNLQNVQQARDSLVQNCTLSGSMPVVHVGKMDTSPLPCNVPNFRKHVRFSDNVVYLGKGDCPNVLSGSKPKPDGAAMGSEKDMTSKGKKNTSPTLCAKPENRPSSTSTNCVSDYNNSNKDTRDVTSASDNTAQQSRENTVDMMCLPIGKDLEQFSNHTPKHQMKSFITSQSSQKQTQSASGGCQMAVLTDKIQNEHHSPPYLATTTGTDSVMDKAVWAPAKGECMQVMPSPVEKYDCVQNSSYQEPKREVVTKERKSSTKDPPFSNHARKLSKRKYLTPHENFDVKRSNSQDDKRRKLSKSPSEQIHSHVREACSRSINSSLSVFKKQLDNISDHSVKLETNLSAPAGILKHEAHKKLETIGYDPMVCTSDHDCEQIIQSKIRELKADLVIDISHQFEKLKGNILEHVTCVVQEAKHEILTIVRKENEKSLQDALKDALEKNDLFVQINKSLGDMNSGTTKGHENKIDHNGKMKRRPFKKGVPPKKR